MVYETEPVGPEGQPRFLNAAVALESDRDVASIRSDLRELEAELGRARTVDPYDPRPLDLDICMVGELQREFDGFQIPDPEVLQHGYLAKTLAEVAPDLIYPGSGKTLAELASNIVNPNDLVPRPGVQRRMELEISSRQEWNRLVGTVGHET
jgi:2-amino-4-hydroxy-6-hydroxymethyldihydropteridine diphosphokinase